MGAWIQTPYKNLSLGVFGRHLMLTHGVHLLATSQTRTPTQNLTSFAYREVKVRAAEEAARHDDQQLVQRRQELIFGTPPPSGQHPPTSIEKRWNKHHINLRPGCFSYNKIKKTKKFYFYWLRLLLEFRRITHVCQTKTISKTILPQDSKTFLFAIQAYPILNFIYFISFAITWILEFWYNLVLLKIFCNA